MKELYLEIRRILRELPDPFDSSKKMFPTVKIDKGQFERIINAQENEEFGYEFPACFVHFVNVSYYANQNRTSDGQGTMRIRFILNRLNDQEDDFETEIFDYAGFINAAIQDAKDTSTVLQERCSLQYFDMPTSSNQLQPCWLDYDVKFTDTSGEKYRTWIDRIITTPTFTNRSDVEGETRPDIILENQEDQVRIVESTDLIDGSAEGATDDDGSILTDENGDVLTF